MADLDIVRQARQVNLADWLRKNNEPLKRAGRWWYFEGCDSLRIQGNKWYRNSCNSGGNSIDFLVTFYGLSPKEAIYRLTHATSCCSNKICGVKEKDMKTQLTSSRFDFNSIAQALDQRRVLAYLCKTRGLSPDVVWTEIKRGLLTQESRTGNAIFAMTNESDEIVGAEVVGTLSFKNIRFKGLKTGSEKGYGYCIGQSHDPHYILFFESAVDMLSFVCIKRRQLKTLTACLLVSMAGLKTSVVQNVLLRFGNGSTIPVLCADNDDAGFKFNLSCMDLFPSVIVNQPDKCFKDWNDQLLALYKKTRL